MRLKNKVKENLKNKKPSIGVILGIYAPSLVEMVGHAGYDFIIIDDEHGTYSASEMENMIRTALLSDLVPIVRVDYDKSSIQKALDRGALGVQVPMINTKEEAVEVVRRAKYPPIGKRGTAPMTRAASFGYDAGKDFMDRSDENIVVIVHIETPEAVRNIEEIVRVDGIDLAFVGPYDLSVNMGYKEGIDHPEVNKAIDFVYEKAKENHIAVGTVANTKERIDKTFRKGALYIPVVATEVIRKGFSDLIDK
ncbi:aldolase/citrate lyase family protein [Aquibacillus koreensis]|uniref:Aldolase/citrate lyase family protein n=1 Tax=Aquibacillus koreensis TaxID=279446 RepID=A0A9X3WPR5_9BACI|nr:aldolase/citrate lyase family protein [Aquibacillus koreensis]MCT2536121.1 aldolase/citrate lyase family protein [Aquibacillus koreensis]MDC3422046.1 aldolase/citrate lyase family protein [Aquibacillus koreensis]